LINICSREKNVTRDGEYWLHKRALLPETIENSPVKSITPRQMNETLSIFKRIPLNGILLEEKETDSTFQ